MFASSYLAPSGSWSRFTPAAKAAFPSLMAAGVGASAWTTDASETDTAAATARLDRRMLRLPRIGGFREAVKRRRGESSRSRAPCNQVCDVDSSREDLCDRRRLARATTLWSERERGSVWQR